MLIVLGGYFMEIKKHYKLYKDGKQWVTAAVATVAVSTALLMGGVVHADQETTNTQPQADTTNQLAATSNQVQAKTATLTNDSTNNTSTQDYDHQDNGSYGNLDSANFNNNELQVSGWQATNQAVNKNYRYVIAFDATTNTELGRTQVTNVARPDVKNVHNVYNAGESGFNASIKVNYDKMQSYRDAIRIISRYSGQPDGNSDYVDWESQPIVFNDSNQGYLDDFTVNNGQLHVSGWNATNQAIQKDYHYIILFDQTTGHEVTRQSVKTGQDRPDVAKVHPEIVNANKSGFDVNFATTNLNINHRYQIISRYSTGANGEGQNADLWFAAKSFTPVNQSNQGYLDGINFSNGSLAVSGWHATDFSNVEGNHFLILYDETANKQVSVAKATSVTRPDVAKAYPTVKSALNAGFTGAFAADGLQSGHTYAVVSRYSTDANGNGNDGFHTDFWSAPFTLNQTAFSIDNVTMTNDGLHVAGWMASDNQLQQPNAYLFVMNNGKEVARQKLTLSGRPDVAKVYPTIYNSGKSGFDTTIKLSTDQLNQLNGQMQVMLRFVNSNDGNPGNNGATDQYSGNYATNAGNFDYVKVNGNQLEFSGWHAADQSSTHPYQWIIVLENGKEVYRARIDQHGIIDQARTDVAKVYPAINNSDKAGFQGRLTLNNSITNAKVQLVHRFSTDGTHGESGNNIDYWSETLPVTTSYQKGNDGAMVNIRGVIENGKFNIYDMRTNKLIKSLDAGTWENLAYSLDTNSINNVDGYLSYTGWYRPIGTSQDGKTWYKTGAGDWRPILMYAWPSKDVQAQFIKYFVDHGYTNEGYGLTAAGVANLSGDTDTKTLNDYSQNLRYVIEQSIAANKSTSKLANDVNSFMQTVPSLSAASELPLANSSSFVPDISGTTSDDQLIFVNNNSSDQTKGNTSNADSNYRLMNRTLNNQRGNTRFSPELLVGNDIDNSNPVVQAENLNWEYFLLNYGKLMGYNADGNFDGFRVDAADNVDGDVLDQLGQLMNDLYHTKGNQTNANNHLVYNEGYHSEGQSLMDGKGNPELYMDSSMFYTLQNVLGRMNDRDDITHLATNSVVNRANDDGSKTQTPNWSFVTNHDQRKNMINQMIINEHPGVKDVLGTGYKAEYANQAWQEFYADQASTYKQYAEYNVPAQYAILLSNKDTVPQVYYGDLYNETKPYMAEKSIYYDAITTLLKARKEFVSGGQSMERYGNNAVASVRFGKGVADANSVGTDPLSRTTGMAVIVGNNPDMTSNTFIINMGKEHANQQYRNLIDTTDAGLTYDGTNSLNPTTLTTDANGDLYVKVKGFSNPYVSGYLSVWVPVVSGQQDATTSSADVTSQAGKTFESNAALDSHVIYEDFSLYQPEPTSVSEHAYNVIANNAQTFSKLGITDFWMAPAYTPFSMSRYGEGYATNDRYTLGTTKNPTKYGSGEELANAIAALHKAGLKVQEDLVMNQMIGFSGQEAVTVTRANQYGVPLTVDGKTFANQIYFAYTIGGGDGQKNYGGKYLAELQAKYPDLFTTKAISTGVAPDPTTRITQWSAKYENGTSLQNIGIGLAVKLPNGDYAYLNGGNNNKFATTLPEQMGSIDYYVQQELKN
jgi:hypothetical protein